MSKNWLKIITPNFVQFVFTYVYKNISFLAKLVTLMKRYINIFNLNSSLSFFFSRNLPETLKKTKFAIFFSCTFSLILTRTNKY